MRNNRNRRFEYGVMLLLFELMNVGFGVIPPITLSIIISQALLYVGLVNVPWDRWDVCLSAHTVWLGRDWKRLFLSVLEHADDRHLYYNMVSFLWKGKSLETRYSSPNFALLLLFITSLTSCFYVALGLGCAHFFQDAYYLQTCAIGFSGVIFALKVITTREMENSGTATVAGITLPSVYAPWAELVLIHLLVPNSSFMGHLAGILAGLTYTSTPLGSVVDNIIKSITGIPMWHGYSSRRYYRSSSRYYY